MPIIVRQFLEEITRKHRGRVVPPPLIADMFSSAIQAFDDAIANDVLDLFSEGLQSVRYMPDEEIYAILNDHATGGENFKKARLCMYGTTALVALVDPDHENLWLANLGDCQGGGHRIHSHRSLADRLFVISHDLRNRAPDVEFRGPDHEPQWRQQLRSTAREERASRGARMRRRRPRSRCHRSFSMLVRISGLSACCVSFTCLRLIGLTTSQVLAIRRSSNRPSSRGASCTTSSLVVTIRPHGRSSSSGT